MFLGIDTQWLYQFDSTVLGGLGHERLGGLPRRFPRDAEFNIPFASAEAISTSFGYSYNEKNTALLVVSFCDPAAYDITKIANYVNYTVPGVGYADLRGARQIFVLDCCDREIISYSISTGGYTATMAQDALLQTVEKRFGQEHTSHWVEWLTDNGSCFTVRCSPKTGQVC